MNNKQLNQIITMATRFWLNYYVLRCSCALIPPFSLSDFIEKIKNFLKN